MTAGLDKKSGSAGNVFDLSEIGSDSLDNICNFADGRLSKYINANTD